MLLAFFPMKGFLGTGAPFGADLNLVVQLIMGLALIAGVLLAKQERYTAHGICQTTVLLLNLLMIGSPCCKQHRLLNQARAPFIAKVFKAMADK